jgi:hypothetical protein
MRLRIAIIAGLALAIIGLSVYAAFLSRKLDTAECAAAEQADRASRAEAMAADLQRSADALREAQEHADQTRREIERTHADALWRVDDIIDSGALDERVCELASEAYTELVCSPDSDRVQPAAAADTP